MMVYCGVYEPQFCQSIFDTNQAKYPHLEESRLVFIAMEESTVVNPAIFHTRHETFTPPFHNIFFGLRLQILNSITHYQFSK